ncbi:hypothetical protein HDE_14405 [Halotydeus destructor]|nr:hypothetical protein HDE_14405 [Halotydeus destructor]
MNNAERVTVEEGDKPKGNFIRDRAVEKQRKLLRIVLKLAGVKGYNHLDQIKLKNGSYMQGTDIVILLIHALSPGKLITGLSEFVDLLHDAQVAPEMIINEHVRAMLEKLYGRGPMSTNTMSTQTDGIETVTQEQQTQPSVSDFMGQTGNDTRSFGTQTDSGIKKGKRKPGDDYGGDQPSAKRLNTETMPKVYGPFTNDDRQMPELKTPDHAHEAFQSKEKPIWQTEDSDLDSDKE